MSDALSPPEVPDELREWLVYAVEAGASDLHLIAGHPPVLRLHGDLTELPEPPLDAAATSQAMLRSLCPPDAFARLVARTDVDFSFEPAARRAGPSGSAPTCSTPAATSGRACGSSRRPSPTSTGPASRPNWPSGWRSCATGWSSSPGRPAPGKTTTLAMIVNLLNQTGGYRIITVEEPVEYLFPRVPNSVVTQREVGRDVLTFADGLKSGLRQDPDVILVGEIRDRETAQMALSAAETGHLVFTTLHTRDAKGAITPVRRPVPAGRAARRARRSWR